MSVIENEFSNKNYTREYPFFRYSLDFAWPDKKFCVEIDGEQHYRDTEDGKLQHDRDIKKDKLLADNGWYEIRISWSTICLNKASFITFVKNALENAVTVDITKEPWYLEKHKEFLCPICGVVVSAQGNLCQSCYRVKERLVARPDKLILAKEIYETSFSEVAKLYGVSPNTIIKWCKVYELPYHIVDLRNWYRVTVLHTEAIIKSEICISKKQYKVQQLDLCTLELIAEFNSYQEASKSCNITCDNISRVCRGLRKSAGGFMWRLIELS